MHRAWRRRNLDPAFEGASAALRYPAGRSRLLFHHLRLDDVELGSLGTRLQATLLLYDGSPFHPSGMALFDYAEAEGMTLFGTSAKYLDACSKAGVKPIATHPLAALRTMTSTGSPLLPKASTMSIRR
jgi:hypothetical protein